MSVFRHITPILDKHDTSEHTTLKYKLLRNPLLSCTWKMLMKIIIIGF